MADKRISQLAERTDIANNDVVAIVASGATVTNKATISSIQSYLQGALDVGVESVGVTIGESGSDVNVVGSPITTSGNITINIPSAGVSERGVLTSEDYTSFLNKQNTITLTTSGTSGDATFDGSLLNIPNYTTDTSGFVTLGTDQTITGIKTFGNNALQVASGGSGSFPTVIRNITVNSLISGGFNHLGFNNLNNIYFSKGSGSFNAGVFAFNNTGTRTYTLPDASGTLALTSDLTGFVTLDTAQTITGVKTFFNRLILGQNSQLVFTQKQSFFLPNEGESAIDAQNNTFIFASSLPNVNSAPQRKLFTFDTSLLPINIQRDYQLPNASGVLALTSNLNSYLPLTGGTLTGALNGTSAVFSLDSSFNGVSIGRGGGNVSTNTRVGLQALLNNTTGSQNTAIGRDALLNNTTGINTIALGYFAGVSIADNTILTDASNSIFIGHNTKAAANNQLNQIVIGHTAVGLGSNTTVLGNINTSYGRWFGNLLLGDSDNTGEQLQVTGTARITGGVNLATVSGNVGIGTTTPVGKLEVNTGFSAAYFTRTAGDDGLLNPVVVISSDSSKGIIGASGDSLTFRVRSVGTSNPLGGTTVMTLLPTGNVGIGTPTPSAKLEVNGTVGFNTTHIPTTDPNISGRIYRNALGQLFISQ